MNTSDTGTVKEMAELTHRR